MPAPMFVSAPLVGPSFAPRGRFNPNGNGLDMVANGTPPPSTDAVKDVLPRKPSVPELPETPAACMTETPYRTPYAPRKAVFWLILYAKPNRGPKLLRSVGV